MDEGWNPPKLADGILVFHIDDFFACRIFHVPAVQLLDGAEPGVVRGEGHLHPAGFEVEDDEDFCVILFSHDHVTTTGYAGRRKNLPPPLPNICIKKYGKSLREGKKNRTGVRF